MKIIIEKLECCEKNTDEWIQQNCKRIFMIVINSHIFNNFFFSWYLLNVRHYALWLHPYLFVNFSVVIWSWCSVCVYVCWSFLQAAPIKSYSKFDNKRSFCLSIVCICGAVVFTVIVFVYALFTVLYSRWGWDLHIGATCTCNQSQWLNVHIYTKD